MTQARTPGQIQPATPRGPTRPLHEQPLRASPTSKPRARLLTALLLAAVACKPANPPTPPTSQPASTSPASREPPETLHGPIVSIDLTGTSRESEARTALSTSIGAAYNPAQIARDVRALWRLRGLSDVQVDARQTAEGVALRYRIVELPQIRQITLDGGSPLYTTATRTRVATIKNAPQDTATIKALAEELRAELISHAFLDATVDWRTVAVDKNHVDVILTVQEGPKVTLASLTLRGNRRLKTPELEALLRTRSVAVGQPFTPAATSAAILAVLARYRDLGHINAELGASTETRSADRTTMSVTYELIEGDLYRLGKLEIRGALVAPVRDYEKRLGTRPGQIFNQSQLASGIDKIRALHRERNAGEPNITPDATINKKTKTVDLLLEIAKP